MAIGLRRVPRLGIPTNAEQTDITSKQSHSLPRHQQLININPVEVGNTPQRSPVVRQPVGRDQDQLRVVDVTLWNHNG